LNKAFSILASAGLATATIVIRATNWTKGKSSCASDDYKFIYWMLFIFYSFMTMSEIFEIFLFYNKSKEKGILGLLFEINYFCGLYITYRVFASVFGSPECADTAPMMYKWLVVQCGLFGLLICVTILLCFCKYVCKGCCYRKNEDRSL
jgi:hypothetical protein